MEFKDKIMLHGFSEVKCRWEVGEVGRWERWKGNEVARWQGGKGGRVVKWEGGRFLVLFLMLIKGTKGIGLRFS